MSLNKILEEITRMECADFFGFADLSPAKRTIDEQGGKLVSQYPRSISVGIILPYAILDELPNRQERGVAVNYRNIYDVTNQRLDIITIKLSGLLQKEGYKALPVPAS